MSKLHRTGYGFAKKGTKILGHWGSKESCHSEALAEESLLKGTKLLRHYGTKRVCHSEGETRRISMLRRKFINLEILRFAQDDVKVLKKCAFTLSEVLIVLAVLGVIAAMTIPDLVTTYQHKSLETQFRKAVSTISQIILFVESDLDEHNLYSFCSKSSNNAVICYESIIKYANLSNKNHKRYGALFYDLDRNNDNILTYNGKARFIHGWGSFYSIYYTNKMTNGGFLGFQATDGTLRFTVDLNGYKKPNQVGHDIFMFELTKDDIPKNYGYCYHDQPNNNITDEDATETYKDSQSAYKDQYMSTYGYPCNLTSERDANGIGCTYFALKNECPYDVSRKYFECLP